MVAKSVGLSYYDAAHFWDQVDIRSNGCWEWTGNIGHYGYGIFCAQSTTWRASRASFFFCFCDPGDLHVLHKCDNRKCVSPHHLFLGTNEANVADRVKKNRTAKHESHSQAKLTKNDAAAIRVMSSSGSSLVELSKRFGVSPVTVWQVVHHKTWRF